MTESVNSTEKGSSSNDDNMLFATSNDSESLTFEKNATRDDDSVTNRVENRNNDKSATTKSGAMLKDGGRSESVMTESLNSTEKGSSSNDDNMFLTTSMDSESLTFENNATRDDFANCLELVCHPPSCKSQNTTARSEWCEDVKNEVAVRMKWVILSIDGLSFRCYLCDKTVKARWAYSPDSYMGKTGHIHTKKHIMKLDAKLWNIRWQKNRIAKGKQPEKVVKHFAQSTMMGFFCGGSTATTTSRSTRSQSITSRTLTPSQSTTSNTLTRQSTNSSVVTASIATGCTGVIPLKLCEAIGSEYNLNIVHKYGRLDTMSEYILKAIGETLTYNLYHNSCTGRGVHLVGKRQGGIRCVKCMDLWTWKSSRIKKKMKSRIDNLKRAERLLLIPNLTQEDARSMRDFSRTGAQSLNDNGQRLKEMVKERNECEYMYIV